MSTQRLSMWVALRCKEAQFRQFLGVQSESAAADVVRSKCGIESRSELDSNPEAAQRFHSLIRIPFSHFTGQSHAANHH